MKRALVPLALFLVFVTLVGGGIWLLWSRAEPQIEARIIAEARARGFELSFEDYEVEGETLVLHRATVRPLDVRGIAVQAERVTLVLRGLGASVLLTGEGDVELESVSASGVDVHLLGSGPALALEVTRWTEQHAGAYELRLSATDVALAWRLELDQAPWVTFAGASVTRHGDETRFEAPVANVSGVELGPVGASWAKAPDAVGTDPGTGRVELGLGRAEGAPVQLVVDPSQSPKIAELTLAPTPLLTLGDLMGAKLPLGDVDLGKVNVEGRIRVQLPDQLGVAIPGELSAKLVGYVPPHPPELEGFVFGNETTFDTRLEINPALTKVTLTDSRVTAGRFVLKGGGEILRAADHARILMDLRGELPCRDLAGAAAESRLGKALGSLAAKYAKQKVQGSVSVRVLLDADSRKLAETQVTRTIGVGCGLRPAQPPTAKDLRDLARDLPQLIEILPQLPTQLPPLPTRLPELPQNLPQGLPQPTPAPSAAP